jgi:predicted transposase YbfD/YdcC
MLASIDDPRDPRGRQYRIGFVLAVAVVATLAGAKNYAEIARKAADLPQELLRKLGAKWHWFTLMFRWPSWSVFRTVLSRIDGNAMDQKVGQWLFTHARKDASGEWELALDGKVMRGAWTEGNDQFTLFSAMIHREAVTVAQVSVPAGTNEITQAATLLKAIDSLGIAEGETVLITLDAAHTCTETATEIKKRPGFEYLMTVKGNRKKLQRAVFDKVLPALSGAPHDLVREHSRGRIKQWSCWIASADGIEFPGASQVAFIRREVFEVSGQRVGKENALMITSGEPAKMTAEYVSQKTREHWGIENMSHYPRDTVYREDHCQAWAGEGPQGLASLHNLAIGLFHLNGTRNIKETTEWIAGDRMRALQFMAT